MSLIEYKTVQDIWISIDQHLKADKGPYADVKAVYEFQLQDEEDGVYQLVFDNGTAIIYSASKEKPDCTLKMKVKYFKKFLLGNLNSTTAFMTGKLKIDGNIGLALKLENMLKQYDFSDESAF